jgi:outer membrane receptor protein involved in Fe transport
VLAENPTYAAPTGDIEGEILTPQQSPVGDARVVLKDSQGRVIRETRSSSEGLFAVPDLAPGRYIIEASLQGFDPVPRAIDLAEGHTVRVRLLLASRLLPHRITVAASRDEQQVENIPAHVSVLTREDIQHDPAVTLDDTLRRIPSFSLFRRTSSLVAHPTTEGVSLRGVGTSGPSRTLVLLDGLPHNDAFGNWIYWSKIPPSQIAAVEVVEGGISDQYGSSAMGGVISVRSRPVSPATFDLRAQVGTLGLTDLDAFGSQRWGPWGVILGGRAFRTSGYVPVREAERGPVDTRADSRHEIAHGRIEYGSAPSLQGFAFGRLFHEDRANGTRLQENSTREGLMGAGIRGTTNGSAWNVTGYARLQTFRSSFSSVTPDRAAETLALLQEVPSRDRGVTALWNRRVAARHSLSLGADLRWIGANNREHIFLPSGATARHRNITAEQLHTGFYFSSLVRITPRAVLGLGGRADSWRNFDASRTEILVSTGALTRAPFTSRAETALSPRVSLLYRLAEGFALRGALYQSFRAPTLNELYRSFRVGNVLTVENDALRAERLTGGEFGLNLLARKDLFWRATAFWNCLREPVSNVTVSVTPDLITRQRQNLGRAQVRGVESDIEYRPATAWSLQAAYLFSQATVRDFAAQPDIIGNVLPQAPRHRATTRVQYALPRFLTISLQARFESHRFDDDLNRLKLGSFWVCDVAAFRPWRERWELFIAVENLFNRRYPVQAIPVQFMGMPRTVHGGARFYLSGR